MSFTVFHWIRGSHGDLSETTRSESLCLLLSLDCLLPHHPFESLEGLIFRAVLEDKSKLCHLLALFAACNFFLLDDLINSTANFESYKVFRWYQFQGNTTQLIRTHCIFTKYGFMIDDLAPALRSLAVKANYLIPGEYS